MVKVTVFVEGGGDNHALKTDCRRAFSTLIAAAMPGVRRPRIVACGARTRAWRQFESSVCGHGPTDELTVLLVDSEGPVASQHGAAAHLRQRDSWECPTDLDPRRVHLMIQCMETWIAADIQMLRIHFGSSFKDQKLPKNTKLEAVSKSDLFKSLDSATRATSRYEKGRVSFELLAKVDPRILRERCPSAARLFDDLESLLVE